MRSHTLQSVVLPFLVVASASATAAAQGWTLRNTLTAPAARNSHAMCYDVTRGVAVMFGGYDGTNVARGDLWEWNGFGWVPRIAPNGPQARWGHGMAFDTRRSRAVMFGGYMPATGFVNETWEWDGASWQQRVTATAPSARGYYGMTYDSIRGRSVVFGGTDNALSMLGDTWEFDGNDWAQSAVSGPSGRRGPTITFDDTRGNVVLFGGGDATQAFGDTWTYDGLAWTQRTTLTAPSPRQEARLVHDTLCGRAVLHGGADAAFANNYGDSWAWDGTSWTQLAGTSPQGRHGAAAAFDAQKGQTVMFGGRDANGFYADTWQIGSPCTRTMSVVTAPQVGNTAAFRFDYPGAAAGHFYFHLLAGHQQVPYAVPIPGLTSIGLSRVDLFNIYLQPSGLLDASGSNLLNVGIPPDNFLAGLPFDVQAVDFNFFTNTLYWANNDAEVSIAPVIPPVASFTATPTFGALPLVVHFTDTSTNAPTSWQWDFDNDGVVDSTLQNPTHSYTTSGIYSVSLSCANIGGTSTVNLPSFVNAGGVVNPALDLVWIPPGSFMMGSPNGSPNQRPVHQVTISQGMWMGKHEVTQEQYLNVMSNNPSYHQGVAFPGHLRRPVERVSFASAQIYCATLTSIESAAGRIPPGFAFRLPTEAEWEYACRAGTAGDWSLGASPTCADANFSTTSPCLPPGQTAVVGSYSPNPWGLCDMYGNVWEMCLDAWDFSGPANYPSVPVVDPIVRSGNTRIWRGGSFLHGSTTCSSPFRHPNPGAFYDAGFRVVLGRPVTL